MSGDGPERLAYPLPEAARLLGVSLTTMKRLIEHGEVPVVRIAGRRRVARSALFALLEEAEAKQEAHG